MLFFTMAVLSTGFSYKHSMEKDLERVAPYDASISVAHWNFETDDVDYDSVLKDLGIDLSKYGNHVSVKTYRTEVTGQDLFSPFATGEIKEAMEQGVQYDLRIMSYSDYIKLAKFRGITPTQLNDNETLILSNMNTAFDTIKNFIADVDTVDIVGKPLKVYKKGFETMALENEHIGHNFACFVVPDELVSDLRLLLVLYNIDYTTDPVIANSELAQLATKMLEPDFGNPDYNMRTMTKEMAYIDISGQTTPYVYICIYIGMVFLIASGAVLALQLLSEASDSKPRYHSLKRIGATDKQIRRAILSQVSLYFVTPLILALSHAAFTIYFVNSKIVYGTSNLLIPAIFTICIFLLLYGSYLLATYKSYIRMIK